MATTKLTDNNRRVHAAKVLAQTSNKNKGSEGNAINNQIRIIRGDVLRLRKDLAHGYDLLKEWIETKISRRTLIKLK